LLGTAFASLLLVGTVHAGATNAFTETFDDGSNTGGWSWGTGNETFSPLNGHPGPFLQDLTLSSCCPAVFTAAGGASVFTGDYRANGVQSVGIDLITLDASFGVGGRLLTVMLINDAGTPVNFDDDVGAYFVGDLNIPDPGVPALTPAGWTEFDFAIPAQSETLPQGWSTFGPGGVGASDAVWNAVITDVDMLWFNYGDPTSIYLFLSWDVGIDNARIVAVEPVSADLDGDGAVGFSDLTVLLGAWGPCAPSCATDLDGDGITGFADLTVLLASWS
jgi:hypothetical protein